MGYISINYLSKRTTYTLFYKESGKYYKQPCNKNGIKLKSGKPHEITFSHYYCVVPRLKAV